MSNSDTPFAVQLAAAQAKAARLSEAVTEALNRHYRIINDDDEPTTDEEAAFAHRLETALSDSPATSDPLPAVDATCSVCAGEGETAFGRDDIHSVPCPHCRPKEFDCSSVELSRLREENRELRQNIEPFRYKATGCFCLGVKSHNEKCDALSALLARDGKEGGK